MDFKFFTFVNRSVFNFLFVVQFFCIYYNFNLINAINIEDLDLYPMHVPFFFSNNPSLKDECERNVTCPYRNYLNKIGCWGYEANCSKDLIYSVPSCPGSHGGWVKTKQEQIDLFFTQADFGYIKERKNELDYICRPSQEDDSSLLCVDHLRYCQARNILIDFENLKNIQPPMNYRMDVLKKGQIGGRCELNIPLLEKRLDQKSPLQSWAPELQNFVKFSSRPITEMKCDIVIEKPTFLMKLDATVNMYHHFCDFVNLYLSQHMNNSFSKDINILLWDTTPYFGNFKITWKAFTDNPILNLQNFVGKKVCFRDLIFTYLARMIFGMYYNMPLVPGCHGSGFFHAFTHHVLHRIGIKQNNNQTGKLRVTLLSRETTYRKILNEDKLVEALARSSDFQVIKVNFNHAMPFEEQLKIIHNSDILIGIHGAGLTHLLFLPDWAVVFEIYNCEDEACYRDLAHLRGIRYITWEDPKKLYQQDEGHHPTMGAHAKFTNYAFDVEEFLRLMHKAKNLIKNDHKWIHDEF